MHTNQANIHPTAIVSPESTIGNGVSIGAFAIVEKDTVIGDGTIIDSHAIIREGARIGKDCHIHPGAVIAGIPQDLKFKGEKTEVHIGDRCNIREYVTINRGTASKGKTVIGNDCLIMAYSHVAHDCTLGEHVIIGNSTQIAGEVVIEDYAILSSTVLVHQFVRIAGHCMIQGGSRIGKDIPPYSLIGRDPASYCGINIVGLRRRHFTDKQIFDISETYRIIYSQGLNTSQALKVIEERLTDSPEVSTIVRFIRSTERGIVRGTVD